MSATLYANQVMPYPPDSRYLDLIEVIRRKKVFFLCLSVSMGLHILFLVEFISFPGTQHKDPTISHSVDITLTKYLPEEAPQVHKKPEPKKRHLIQKSKLIDPSLVATTETRPVIEKKIIEDGIYKEVENEPAIEETIAQNTSENRHVNAERFNSEKEEYLSVIAAHLDRHKFYPRSARRRHIEGDVNISFDLLMNGEILNLEIRSGHSALQKATLESINSAKPLPPRPEKLLSLNTMKIEYSMRFSLEE